MKNHLGNEGANGVMKASTHNIMIDFIFMSRIVVFIILGTKIDEAFNYIDKCTIDTSFGEGLLSMH